MSANSCTLITQRENKRQNETNLFRSSNWKWWTRLLPAIPQSWRRCPFCPMGHSEGSSPCYLHSAFFRIVSWQFLIALQGFALLVIVNSFELPHLDLPLTNYRHEAWPHRVQWKGLLCPAQRKFYQGFCLRVSCPDFLPFYRWGDRQTVHTSMHAYSMNPTVTFKYTGKELTQALSHWPSIERRRTSWVQDDSMPTAVCERKFGACSKGPWIPRVPWTPITAPFHPPICYPTPGTLRIQIVYW